MSSAAETQQTVKANDTQGGVKPTRGSGLRFPQWRAPDRVDALLFFVLLPIAIAFLFSLVEIRLTKDVPYPVALLYMVLHMFVAWWMVSAGCFLIKYICRNWRPPGRAVCVMGFVVSLIPAAMLYQWLGNTYEQYSPEFAANWTGFQQPSWDIDYLLYFIRFSIPALPLFMAGVYGYRLLTGVNWFGYKPRQPQPTETTVSATAVPRAGQIAECTLPADAVILAIKAEQHYIQIWSDAGKELVRYRFKDLSNDFADANGAQVHRSWWVNFDAVSSIDDSGSKAELFINDELTVPVSRSYRNEVRSRLQQL